MRWYHVLYALGIIILPTLVIIGVLAWQARREARRTGQPFGRVWHELFGRR